MWARIATAMAAFIAVALFAFPRLTTVIDRHLVRKRLESRADDAPCVDSLVTPIDATTRVAANEPVVSALEMLHQLAADTAVGVHPRDALHTIAGSAFPDDVVSTSDAIDSETTLDEAIVALGRMARETNEPDLVTMFDLLRHAQVDSVFVPAAIEDIALIIGVQQGLRHDLRAATAQATFTARFLTWAPLVVLITMTLLSSHIRRTLLWTPTLLTIGLGVGLNRMGAKWIGWLNTRAMRAPTDEAVVLTGHLAISLRAGRSVIDSLIRWRGVTPAGTAVAEAISRGETLTRSLTLLPRTTIAARLTQSIQSTFRDGVPVLTTVQQLMSDVRHESQRHTEAQMRRLPAQLSMPLVLCVLPSFLLLTIAPIAFASIARLAPVISPALSNTN